jgi:thiol-disulfide isomerase/thioredoxin
LAWQNAAGDAETMLQSIDSMRPPSLDAARRQDQAYIKSYIEQRNAFLQSRSDLIKQFTDKFPDHSRTAPLTQERWTILTQTGKTDVVTAEIEQALGKTTDPKKRADLLYAQSIAIMRSSERDSAKVEGVVEKFIKAAPQDERGGMLLYQVARSTQDTAKQTQLLQRVVANYPGSQAADRAKGTLRQTEGIGKPFELAFTEAMTGKQMSMADLKGKVVVIDFWATWCGPCIAEMPKMKQLYAEYKPKGVEFIGISLDNPESEGGLEKLKAYCKENNIEWPQYYQGKGWQGEFSMSWGINSIPAVFIVDADGKLHSTQARGQLEKLIPELLAKRDGKST